MVQARLTRVFWIAAAATVVVAGLFALVAVIGGNFDETDGKILGTLGTALLAGAVATVGGTLVESSLASPLGKALVGVALVAAPVSIAAIWNGFDSSGLARAAGSSYVLLATGVLVGTARVLVGERRRLVPLFAAVCGFALLASGLSVGAIVAGPVSSGYGKGLAAVWIVTGIAYLLVPIARRLVVEPAGSGPEPVDLAAGVEAAGVRMRLATGHAKLGRETVVVVLAGEARAGTTELGPGDAVVAGAGTELDVGESGQALLIGR